MRIGLLRQRVTIEQPVYTNNTIGEPVTTWSTFATVWAAIEPNTGQAYYLAKQTESTASGRIRMRYRDGIKPTMRVKYGERYFTIISVIQPKENSKELHLIYSEALD